MWNQQIKDWIRQNCLGFVMDDPPINWDESKQLFVKMDGYQYLVDFEKMETFPEFIRNWLQGR